MTAHNELIEYINSKETCGAVLLTGQWGCGKTYLINNLVKETALADKYVMIVISLFGIDSISMLTNKIKERVALAIFPVFQALKEKSGKYEKPLTAILDGLMQQTKVADKLAAVTAFMPIENEIGLGDKKKTLVLIFDDFERSKIDIVELLGAINEYAETKKIKTILIADEERILVREDGAKYTEFKEKVIFHTVKLRPDFRAIIHQIIIDYSETTSGYQQFLVDQEERIYQIFGESKGNNLRTIKVLLIEFERVFSLLVSEIDSIDNLGDILYSFCAMLLEVKAGNYKKGEYGYIFADKDLKQKYPHFNRRGSQFYSLQKWITEGEWNPEQIIAEYKQKYALREELTDDQKFLVWRFWDLDSSIFNNGYPIVLEKAYQGELPTNELISLLEKAWKLEQYPEIRVPCVIDYDRVLSGLQSRIKRVKDGIITEQLHSFIPPEVVREMCEKAQEIYRTIERMRNDLLNDWVCRREYLVKIKLNNISALYELQNRNYGSFDTEMEEAFIQQYIASDNSMKRQLLITLSKMYFDNDHDDLPVTISNLQCLIEEIQNLQAAEEDDFTRIINQECIKELHKMIDDYRAKITLEGNP